MERLALALIAHDSKKGDMVCLLKAHQEELAGLDLVAEFLKEMAAVHE
ncbi:MAG: hypothetical protein U9O84_00120 [Chloroflexota bacterium]|nr:hypothetical protein [Chloroflexota bacterium]